MVTVEPANTHGLEYGTVRLVGFAEQEGTQYVSSCPALGTSSCGDTASEALENLRDAIDVHIRALIETGELLPFFRDRNIRIDIPPADLEELTVTVRTAPGRMFTVYQQDVPAA